MRTTRGGSFRRRTAACKCRVAAPHFDPDPAQFAPHPGECERGEIAGLSTPLLRAAVPSDPSDLIHLPKSRGPGRVVPRQGWWYRSAPTNYYILSIFIVKQKLADLARECEARECEASPASLTARSGEGSRASARPAPYATILSFCNKTAAPATSPETL
jgi:hypothetical protein